MSDDTTTGSPQLFRDRREFLGMSTRDMEGATQKLANCNPSLFSVISRGMVTHIETEGVAYLLRSTNRRKVAAYLTVLFGSVEAFADATGISLPIFAPIKAQPEPPKKATPSAVPVVREGDVGVTADSLMLAQALHEGQHVFPLGLKAPEWPCDFLFQVTSHDMAPVLYPGQTVGVARTAACMPGRMAVIVQGGEARIAWALPAGRFAVVNLTTATSPTFTLKRDDSVVGVVTWIQPQLPISASA